uniref:BTB domain-containing protein n=1 Tax=Ditylenchus dipsaci TaxID=166011 RepID=A0A915CXI9_9BILA
MTTMKTEGDQCLISHGHDEGTLSITIPVKNLISSKLFQSEKKRIGDAHWYLEIDLANQWTSKIKCDSETEDYSYDVTYAAQFHFIRETLAIAYLAIHSEVFDKMFFSNFCEKDKDEIELGDLDHDEFIQLLGVIYPCMQQITDANVEGVLKLADRFQMIPLVERYHSAATCICMSQMEIRLFLHFDQLRIHSIQPFFETSSENRSKVVRHKVPLECHKVPLETTKCHWNARNSLNPVVFLWITTGVSGIQWQSSGLPLDSAKVQCPGASGPSGGGGGGNAFGGGGGKPAAGVSVYLGVPTGGAGGATSVYFGVGGAKAGGGGGAAPSTPANYFTPSPAAGAPAPVDFTKTAIGGIPMDNTKTAIGGIPMDNTKTAIGGIPFDNTKTAIGGIPMDNTKTAIGGIPFDNTKTAIGGIPMDNTKTAIGGIPFDNTKTAIGGIPFDNTKTAIGGIPMDNTKTAIGAIPLDNTKTAIGGIPFGNTKTAIGGIPMDNTKTAIGGIPFDNTKTAIGGIPMDNTKTAIGGIPFDNTKTAIGGIPFDNTKTAIAIGGITMDTTKTAIGGMPTGGFGGGAPAPSFTPGAAPSRPAAANQSVYLGAGGGNLGAAQSAYYWECATVLKRSVRNGAP